MKEEQIKEMLNGIINNGEKWECRHSVQVNKSIDFPEYEWSDWQSYKLGDKIHDDWEYRKVEIWFVYGHINNFKLTSKFDTTLNIWHKGTKEDCEKWIKEYKKSWIEEICGQRMKYEKDYLKEESEHIYNSTKYGIKQVCKKILKEVRSTENRLGSIVFKDVEDIIKDLGVKID